MSYYDDYRYYDEIDSKEQDHRMFLQDIKKFVKLMETMHNKWLLNKEEENTCIFNYSGKIEKDNIELFPPLPLPENSLLNIETEFKNFEKNKDRDETYIEVSLNTAKKLRIKIQKLIKDFEYI